MVTELIDPSTKRWRLDVLGKYFIDMDKEFTLNIPLSSLNLQDTWAVGLGITNGMTFFRFDLLTEWWSK